MRLRIPNAIVERWASDLKRAGLREIGGVLFGEQIAEGDFRIVEATRQRFWGGTVTTFKRRGGAARKEILRLHERTGGNPERFNYLGEWHSHPMAPTVPSCRDETTMYELLADQAGAVNFLLLVIVRLDEEGQVRVGAQTYLGSGHKLSCGVEIEGADHDAMDVAFDEEEEEK
ncbi:Mov34/MPN/PAD-1 family protein [Primorskyibacter flagellatus]|uniref:JAB domain-containing protein n=1 Tax=Primorskyibacter flagellatus TaxID=1387277 RepID=A0A1W2DQR8_9RHOB|nr:Mov34/MPN/PAD-1 family protein [Primorskyibacter flagellatus]SMC99743.1 JAB domain-containing protein [Primorskyibacter flagellatus]